MRHLLVLAALLMPFAAHAAGGEDTRCELGQDVSYDARPDLAHIELTVIDGGGPKGLAVTAIAEGKAPFKYGKPLYDAMMAKQVVRDGTEAVAIFRFRNIDLPSALGYVGNYARCGGTALVTPDPDARGWVEVQVPFRWHTSVLIEESTLARARGNHPLVCVSVRFVDGSDLDFIPPLAGNSLAWPKNTVCAPDDVRVAERRPGDQAYRFLVIKKTNTRGGQ